MTEFYHFPHILFIRLFTNLFLLFLCLFWFVTSLFKVLYGQWIVMGCLALPIIVRQAKIITFVPKLF